MFWEISAKNCIWLLHVRTENGVIPWYVLAPQRLFDFIVCVVSFIFFLFSYFLWSLNLVFMAKQWSCLYVCF